MMKPNKSLPGENKQTFNSRKPDWNKCELSSLHALSIEMRFVSIFFYRPNVNHLTLWLPFYVGKAITSKSSVNVLNILL